MFILVYFGSLKVGIRSGSSSSSDKVGIVSGVKDTLWVSAPSTLGLCVFPSIFAIYSCKLT